MSAVLLSSGGLDSALLAAMHPGALHLSVNYGQEHLRELASARKIAAHYGSEHIERLCRLPAKKGEVVPGRNATLIAIAASHAQARDLEVVLIGCNADDAADFPDCRPGFIAAMREVVQRASEGRVTLEAPLLTWSKQVVGHTARELNVPVAVTWSCYRGGDHPCGTCGACEGRTRAGV